MFSKGNLNPKKMTSTIIGSAVGGAGGALLAPFSGSFQLGCLLYQVSRGNITLRNTLDLLVPFPLYLSQPIQGAREGGKLGFQKSFLGAPKFLFTPASRAPKHYEKLNDPDKCKFKKK